MRADAPVPRDTTYVVAPIVIEAARPDRRTDLAHRSGFVATVDMTKRTGRVEDLTAVLSQLVGVHVTQYGGLGSFATVSIRGSSSSQVRTFLDGMPVDDPYLGVTDLSDLPLGGVGRVEVYRGFSPPQLGGSAIGGAVNLVTRERGAHSGVLSGAEANVSGGSFDTRRENGSLWLDPGPVRVFAHVTHEQSLGDFTFLDDNDTPYNPDDNEPATRVNNDFDAWTGIVRAAADIPHLGTASLAYHDASRENGVPGLGAYQSTTARADRRRRIAQLRLDGVPQIGDQIHWWLDGFYQRANERFVDRTHDVSLLPQDTDNTIDSYGGRARARWYVPWIPVALEGAFEGQKDIYHPVSNVPAHVEGPDRWRNATTTSIGADVYLFKQTLVLTATERFERHEDEFFAPPRLAWLPPTPEGRVTHEETTPSAGLRWQARSWLVVKGNVGRTYRLPTFLELFGNTGSVTGNSELEPERGTNRDVGMVITLPRLGRFHSLFFEGTYFDNTAENLILFFPNSQYTSKPSNIGSSRIRGWEVSAAATLSDRFEVSAGYTRLDTEDTGDIPTYHGNQLPSRPRDDVNASLSGRAGALRLTYELHYIGANWLDRYNVREAPARTLHGAVATVRTPVPGLSFTVEGRNLTDERVVDVAGYPLPGRSVYSTLSYHY